MLFNAITVTAFGLLSTLAPAVYAAPAPNKDKNVVVTTTTVVTTVVPYNVDIDTTVYKKGTSTVVPDQITLTFKKVPTHVVLHTTATSTTTYTVTATITSTPSKKNPKNPPSAATSTTSAAAPVATKTNVSGCNQQGTAGEGMQEAVRHGPSYMPDFESCQESCFFDTPCQSYGYNPTTGMCSTFMAPFSITPGETGTFFSAKYPGDGSNYCYGSTEY